MALLTVRLKGLGKDSNGICLQQGALLSWVQAELRPEGPPGDPHTPLPVACP